MIACSQPNLKDRKQSCWELDEGGTHEKTRERWNHRVQSGSVTVEAPLRMGLQDA